MKKFMKLFALLFIGMLCFSCENEETLFFEDNNEMIVAARSANSNAVLKAEYEGCISSVYAPITVEGTTFPYYVESEIFKFDGIDVTLKAVPVQFRVNEDGSLYYKLFHIMVDVSNDTNSFYSLDIANWTPTDDPTRFNVNIKGDILGGTGTYCDKEGTMKMNGKARFTPDCPSFYLDVKIKVKFK